MYLTRTVEVALWEPWNVEDSLRGRDPNRNFGFSLHPSQPSRISPPQEHTSTDVPVPPTFKISASPKIWISTGLLTRRVSLSINS